MNIDHISLIARRIRKLEQGNSYQYDGARNPNFSMCFVNYKCGSPACIGGWVLAEMGMSDPTIGGINAIMEYFEIPRLLAIEIFGPETWGGKNREEEFGRGLYEDISPARASAMLENLIETGKVDWYPPGFEAGMED